MPYSFEQEARTMSTSFTDPAPPISASPSTTSPDQTIPFGSVTSIRTADPGVSAPPTAFDAIGILSA